MTAKTQVAVEVPLGKASQDDAEARTGRSEAPEAGSGISVATKLALLIVLCLQNAIYTMLRRYSVGVLNETYTSSSVLMVGEIIKLVFSVVMTLSDSSASSAKGTGLKKLVWLLRVSAPMSVPAIIFWLMNLLSYVSLRRIDASTFTVCAQMKILTTAVFSMIIMRRNFHPRKWRALVLLVLGVTLVSNGSYVSRGDDDEGDGEVDGEGDDAGVNGEDEKAFGLQYMIGVAAVLLEVTLSGFVSVFFERVLKSKVVNLSVWDRNFQLSVYSIFFYLLMCLREEGSMFKGWSMNAVWLSILGSAGGLLVAFTMKYTDAVLKTFATSGSIILCAVAGFMLLDAPLDIPISVGAFCTVLALLNYSDDGGDSTPPAWTKVPPSLRGNRHPSSLQVGTEEKDESTQSLLERPLAASNSEAV